MSQHELKDPKPSRFAKAAISAAVVGLLDPDGAHGRERLVRMRAALHALLDSETLTHELDIARAALVARGNKRMGPGI